MSDFDWNRYLDLARELLPKESEAAQRTAVSRAYYAVYHAARRLSPGEPFTTTHEQLWRSLKQNGAKGERRLGERGNRLKLERHEADYTCAKTKGDWRQRAEDAVAEADKLVALANSEYNRRG